ncbi:MAG: ABC transporter ATP-binding protein [Betaproteobacteria bacterium]|nr:ABC transporter ATP-binding protein [Betaproteobacteria bacterium]
MHGCGRSILAHSALQIKGLSAGYGAARVLHGIDLTVERGETMVVIGRNGVGKTTLVETICGLTSHHAGEIIVHGTRVEALPAYKRNRLGVGWVPQEREVFKSLTVDENIRIVGRAGAWTPAKIYALFPRLAERRRNYGSQLSGGEQQMLAIARSLATNPTLLLLDEPVEGLAPLIVQELVRVINQMRSEGSLALVLVEQKHEIALANSDRCVVIDHGEIVHRSASRDLLADAETLERLIGVAA